MPFSVKCTNCPCADYADYTISGIQADCFDDPQHAHNIAESRPLRTSLSSLVGSFDISNAAGIPMLAMFGCGASSVTSNSRMCWSFSRDGGLPFGRYLSAVNKW